MCEPSYNVYREEENKETRKTVKIKIKASQLFDVFLPKRNGELLIKTDCTESKDGKATIQKFPNEITLDIPEEQIEFKSALQSAEEKRQQWKGAEKSKPKRKDYRVCSPFGVVGHGPTFVEAGTIITLEEVG